MLLIILITKILNMNYDKQPKKNVNIAKLLFKHVVSEPNKPFALTEIACKLAIAWYSYSL